MREIYMCKIYYFYQAVYVYFNQVVLVRVIHV